MTIPSLSAAGKVVVVTGASKGLGRAMTLGFAEAGADVVELQELLGHASLETTRRYLSATAQGLRHVIQSHPSQAALRQSLADSE